MNNLNIQPLDTKAIVQAFPHDIKQRIIALEVVEQTNSTNDRVLSYIDVVSPGFYVCLAESQTAGKGRCGKNIWLSPKNGNLYLSVLYRNQTVRSRQSGWIALMSATEVVSALVTLYKISNLAVKWPNDIYCGNNKLAGVLVESKRDRYVVGLGLNIFPPAKGEKKSGMAWLTHGEIDRRVLDRNNLSALIISAIISAVDRVAHDSIDSLMRRWQQYDLLQDCQVSVLVEKETVIGVARGVNEDGGLQVEVSSEETNEIRVYYSNEVSIRW